MSDEPNILFFLGSGVSAPSGLPMMRRIEERIFDDLEWVPAITYFGELTGLRNPTDERLLIPRAVQAFLKTLQRVIQDVFDLQAQGPTGFQPHQVNYEDLFYACDQIEASERGYGREPSAGLLAERIRGEAQAHLQSYPHAEDGVVTLIPGGAWKITDLAWTAFMGKALIKSVVLNCLSEKVDPEGLDAVLGAACSEEASRTTVVTLNHDCLIEELFEAEGMEAGRNFEDGFAQPVSPTDLRPYEPERLFLPETTLRVIKPHGSISWYPAKRKRGLPPALQERGELFRNGYLAVSGPAPYDPDRPYPWPSDTPAHLKMSPAERAAKIPLLLTSYDKDRHYGRDIFGDMMAATLRALDEADVIFVSGFGWNDPGMRQRLLGALDRSKEKRLFILHEEQEKDEEKTDEELLQVVGGLDYATADSYAKIGQLHVFENWLCRFSWEELWDKSRPYLP